MRRAEARHRHGQHILCRTAELLHRAHGHEQRETAVQPAGDADDGGLGVRVGDALGQPVGLHGEDELAALGAAASSAGTNGVGETWPRSGTSRSGRWNATVCVVPRSSGWNVVLRQRSLTMRPRSSSVQAQPGAEGLRLPPAARRFRR